MAFALSNMVLTSTAFEQQGLIPRKYTGEGEDISPPLHWTSAPTGTRGYALVCHDPDAPLVSVNGTYGFVHWALYNIPDAVTSLPEGTGDYTAGRNDKGNIGYGGPMPPGGHGLHHYFFWLMALDEATDLAPGLTLWQLLEKVEPNVIGMSRLVGTYARP